MKCSKCNKEINQNDFAYCPYCGEKISKINPTTSKKNKLSGDEATAINKFLSNLKLTNKEFKDEFLTCINEILKKDYSIEVKNNFISFKRHNKSLFYFARNIWKSFSPEGKWQYTTHYLALYSMVDNTKHYKNLMKLYDNYLQYGEFTRTLFVELNLREYHNKLLSSLLENSVYKYIIRKANFYSPQKTENEISYNGIKLINEIDKSSIMNFGFRHDDPLTDIKTYKDAVDYFNNWKVKVISSIMCKDLAEMEDKILVDKKAYLESLDECIENNDLNFCNIRGVRSEFVHFFDNKKREEISKFQDFINYNLNTSINKGLLEQTF